MAHYSMANNFYLVTFEDFIALTPHWDPFTVFLWGLGLDFELANPYY